MGHLGYEPGLPGSVNNHNDNARRRSMDTVYVHRMIVVE